MTFTHFPYQRPDLEQLQLGIESALELFKDASNWEAQWEQIQVIDQIRRQFSTMQNICSIRHTIDTNNSYYEAENDFFSAAGPNFANLKRSYYQALSTSKFRKELEKKLGTQLFKIADLANQCIHPEIVPQLQRENELVNEYVKGRANSTIPIDGKDFTISTITPLLESSDRTLREKAYRGLWQYYGQNSAKNESIFEELVHLRTEMAKKLGHEDFVTMGYARMTRTDYDQDMVANFREQVRKYVVPLAQKLYKRQENRLGLGKLNSYDFAFKFPSGNPRPKGDPDWILKNAKTMYEELSPETASFFKHMQDNELMDLVSRVGKAPGGYCTFIDEHNAPYIFSNFNGTSGDIDVLTHEAGHAFQVYSSRDMPCMDYMWPTYEACEIHSMSMEFFTWPWMKLFFKEDTDKYYFSHLAAAIKFLPYGVAVDEFQHEVYRNPTISTAERNQIWRRIERKYLPHLDYGDISFLENGGFWQKQGHIFASPFYYIDYTLAQFCAFQFWTKDRENHDSAWKDYLHLCKQGGSHSFLELVEIANLKSPFDPDCIPEVVEKIGNWLEKIDDSQF